MVVELVGIVPWALFIVTTIIGLGVFGFVKAKERLIALVAILALGAPFALLIAVLPETGALAMAYIALALGGLALGAGLSALINVFRK